MLDKEEKLWNRSKKLAKSSFLFSIVFWLFLRFVWSGPLATVHDAVILPIALKGVYAPFGVLGSVALVSAAFMLLWPHGFAWPVVVAVNIFLFTGWVILYDMWQNALLSTSVLSAVVAYVLCRYCWAELLRLSFGTRRIISILASLPICWLLVYVLSRDMYLATVIASAASIFFCVLLNGVARCAYNDVLDLVENDLRCKSYFGAKRTLGRGIGRERWAIKEILEHSNAPAEPVRPSRWRRGFQRIVHLPEPALGALRLIYGRRVPASVQFQWLENILETLYRRCYADVRTISDAQEWCQAYDRLIAVVETKAELLCFTPALVQSECPEALDRAAAMYDGLSRIGLARQLWLKLHEDRPDSSTNQDHKDIWKRRNDIITQAAEFRHFRLDGLLDKQKFPSIDLRRVLQGQASEEAKNIAFQAAVCKHQLHRHREMEAGEDPAQHEEGHQLGAAVERYLREHGSRFDRETYLKTIEYLLDFENAPNWARWVQELQAHYATPEPEADDPAALESVRFEGYFYWALAERIRQNNLRQDCYSKAMQAMAQSASPEMNELIEKVEELTQNVHGEYHGELAETTG